ncbi:MAG: WD40 repeat domain-containing protein [Planctomycetaceae bacterium]|nr:WD40 repeat domain-containing protein [Planctomycetaceae bacterium]
MPINPPDAHVAAQWPHDSPLIACRFDPQGRYAFTSAEDNTVQRWKLADGTKTLLKAHDSWVFALAVTKDGSQVISAGGDGRLIWWPVEGEAPAPIRTVEAHAGWIRGLAVSPDGQFLASAGNDRVVKLWSIADGALVRQFTGHDAHVYSVAFHPSGTWLLTGDLKGAIHQWDVATAAIIRSFDAKPLWSYNGGQMVDFGGVRALAVSPDGKHLAAGGLNNASNPLGAVHDPVALLFEWDTQKLLQTHVAEGAKGSVWRLVFHPEGWLIGVSGGGSGGHVSFWKPDNPKEAFRFALPNIARDMDLHADNLQLATSHHDRHVRLTKLTPKG